MKAVRFTLLTVVMLFQGFAMLPANLAFANQTPERKLAVYELEPRTGLSLADAVRVSRLMKSYAIFRPIRWTQWNVRTR